ncbi:MAG: DUF1772 domain-containing protein [bacterium]
MSSSIVTILLWAAALGSGLMAGVYLAFSGFIMRSFDNIDTAQSVAAMNSINETILRSLFMPLFFGSSIVSVLLIILAAVYWGEPGAGLALLAGTVYFVGMFICTVVFNVPLNNALAALNADSLNLKEFWSHYFITWTRWNHLRTTSSLATCAPSIWVLFSR